jgi:ribosomal protein S18 acetylase RimI-like enzyme
MTIEIVRADISHVAEVGRLFDLYRQFYECPPDLSLATGYISDRVASNESIIWVAMDGALAQGFVQCYSSFCSVQAVKIHILYDLYVEAGHRNTGLGGQLMDQARDHAIADGANRIDLLTQHSNKAGQHLYEKLGYEIANADFHAYSLNL